MRSAPRLARVTEHFFPLRPHVARQVRSLSVKRITNPVMFDKLNNPLRDGEWWLASQKMNRD